MDEQVVQKVLEEVMKKVGAASSDAAASSKHAEHTAAVKLPSLPTEFVGTAMGDTIGLVIANVDPLLHEKMKLDSRYRSIGILGGRVGAGPQIMAADEAVKATNTEVVAIELPRDTKGGAGHGSLIIFGAEEVSDARRAVEVALQELSRTFGDVYVNDAGHLEFQYTARASHALEKAFGAPLGRAFGLIVGAPAAIGVVCCDTAIKAAEVQVVGYASPASGTSFTNEAILFMSGDSGAVRQALIAAREVGITLLATMGEKPQSLTKPYI
ncbi:propanediol utilization microcompartment protein PduB [Desulfofundulus thermobenzoicus]|uniref:Propanediol utilization microcompartment protein PduB n=1 Tax=Desulfofundulus thermobenzoicus TaxID=29376 RepID=A0A6N7ITD5_9FIRM|nr:propanediol utilization microcompartment protein PduB [Desulfofundulus thermobenzoicus]MQL53320.1 propanediol utilization microcompartment protein PduB [Desulfofundulus thermobenzoicus]